jgi:hypothetical protein
MRVRTGMAVLAAIGTDTALTHLNRMARSAKTAGYRRTAHERLTEVAETRGLSLAQLTDRIVPSFGLDAHGRITLDYGPRSFTVTLNEHLTPVITDGDGRRLTRMPKPRADDEPTLAAAAQSRFADLKKELKTVGAERIRTLEEAMVDGRRWSAADFRQLLVEHPLMWQLTRRLVWGIFDTDGRLVQAFRPAEDRSLADINDKTVTIDDDAIVGLPHPWHLGDTRTEWSALFADYEIIQPFPQLSRELQGLPEGTADAPELTSYANTKVLDGRTYALVHKGWDHTNEHTTLLREWQRSGRTVELQLGHTYNPFNKSTNTLMSVRVFVARSTTPACFGDLHPIDLAETLRDIESLRA